jgi:hypothetical protein
VRGEGCKYEKKIWVMERRRGKRGEYEKLGERKSREGKEKTRSLSPLIHHGWRWGRRIRTRIRTRTEKQKEKNESVREPIQKESKQGRPSFLSISPSQSC